MEEVGYNVTSSNNGRSRSWSLLKISKRLVEFSCLIKITKTTINIKIHLLKVNKLMFLAFIICWKLKILIEMNTIQEACYTEILNEKVYEDTGTMATW